MLAKPSPVASIEERCPDQQRLLRPAVPDRAHGERRERGACERRSAQEPDVELVEAEREQVRRQQHRDVAVGERAKRPSEEQRDSRRRRRPTAAGIERWSM